MDNPKRGRTGGRRRNVVSISLPSDLLLSLDRMADTLTKRRGWKVNRSRMVQALIHLGEMVERGEERINWSRV